MTGGILDWCDDAEYLLLNLDKDEDILTKVPPQSPAQEECHRVERFACERPSGISFLRG